MKTIAALIIVILAIPVCYFFYRNALSRSKSNKTSLFGSFNAEYRDDNLGKMTPAALEGLEEAARRKKQSEKGDHHMGHYVKHEDAKPEIMNNGITKRILSYDDSLMVEELIFVAGAQSKTHTHTPVQIPYVKSGVFEFTVGDESFVLWEGDTAYMGPDVPHCVKCIEEGTLVVSFSPVREDYL